MIGKVWRNARGGGGSQAPVTILLAIPHCKCWSASLEDTSFDRYVLTVFIIPKFLCVWFLSEVLIGIVTSICSFLSITYI